MTPGLRALHRDLHGGMRAVETITASVMVLSPGRYANTR